MTRLINAENVEYAFLAICDRESGVPLALAEWLANVVRNAPTVDAVEVVRCKDCAFHVFNSSNETFKCRSMNGMYRTVVPDDFCSYGERGTDV